MRSPHRAPAVLSLASLWFWCAPSQTPTVTTTASRTEVDSFAEGWNGTDWNATETTTTSRQPGPPCECVNRTHEEDGWLVPDLCADHFGDNGCMPWCYVDAGCDPLTPSNTSTRVSDGPYPTQYFSNDTAWVACEQASLCWDDQTFSDTLGRGCPARLAAMGLSRGCSEHSSAACCGCGGGRRCTTTLPAGFGAVDWSTYEVRDAIVITTTGSPANRADVLRLYGSARRDAVLAQERSLLDTIINGNLSEASGDYGYASIVGSVIAANTSESVLHSGGVGTNIPASTLAELGVEEAVVMVTRYGDVDITFEAPTTGSVSGEVVGVTLYSSESRDPLLVAGLEQRIQVNIPVGDSLPEGDQRCAYWSEELNRWTTSGVQTTVAPDGSLICDTSHLTIFTAILAEFENVFACTNAQVLTREGLQAIGEPAWMGRPPFVILLCFTISQIGILVFALRTDARDKATRIWDDANFLTENIEYKDDSTFFQAHVKAMFRFADLPEERNHDKEDSRSSVEAIVTNSQRKISTASGERRNLRAQVWDSVTSEVVCRCALATLARNQKVAVAELPSVFKDKNLKSSIVGTIDTLQKTPFIQQVIALFFVMQPWLKLDNFSIRMSAFIRAVLLVSKLLGALLLSALFFANFDTATARNCPPPSGLGAIIVNCIVVGMFSALLSSIPLLALYQTQGREFIYKDTWTDEERESYVRSWKHCDTICSVCALLYCSLCILYLTAFLANLNPQGENKWLASIVTVLLREFIFTPLTMALMTAMFAEVVGVWNPEVAQNMYKRLGLTLARPQRSNLFEDAGRGLPDDAETPPDDGTRVQDLDEGHAQVVPVDFFYDEPPVWAGDSVLAGFSLKGLPVSRSQLPGAMPVEDVPPADDALRSSSRWAAGRPPEPSGHAMHENANLWSARSCSPEPERTALVSNTSLWNSRSLTSSFSFERISPMNRIPSRPTPFPDIPPPPDVERTSLQHGMMSRPPLFPAAAPRPNDELPCRLRFASMSG